VDYATDLKGGARQFSCASVFLAKAMQAVGTATEDTNLDLIEDSSERAKGDDDDDDDEEAEEECQF
jgi:hypothetical protein